MSDLERLWSDLDPDGEPTVAWRHRVHGDRVAVLLGAFDPPTRAHVAIARGASRAVGAPAALCLTKVLLARPADALLEPVERLHLLDELAGAEGFGLAVANRGTYLEVARALRSSGIEATFVVGSDKLEQLADPSFYTDGRRGVDATFAEVDLLVVPRPGSAVGRDDVVVLETDDVFDDASGRAISSTEVRRRIRAGLDVDALVPPGVAAGVEGYTSAR